MRYNNKNQKISQGYKNVTNYGTDELNDCEFDKQECM